MSNKAKRLEDYQLRIRQGLAILDEVSQDNTTPRNIRRAAKSASDAFKLEEHSIGVKAANAITVLDEISQDPNMPQYTRVKIWNVVSILEAIKD